MSKNILIKKNILAKKNINKLINLEPDLDNYDWNRYINENKDLIEAGINTKESAIKHWIKHGKNEERKIYIINDNINKKNNNDYELFDWKKYIEDYEDLRKAGIDTKDKAWKHWLNYGKNENRIINFNNNIKIDIDIYRLYNKELNKYTDNELIIHFNKFGIHEYRIYNTESFNLKFNLDLNRENIIKYYDNIKDKKTIYIYTPIYNEMCGGIGALHSLYKLILKDNTFNAQLILFNHINRNINLHPKIIISSTDIVIYPEIIYSNPLKASNVIRWILLGLDIETPKDIINTWSKTDIIYNWLPMDKNLKKYNLLYLPFFDNKYTDNNIQRNLDTCYLIKKGVICNLHKNKINKINKINKKYIIDNLSIRDKINAFNSYKYLYTYDPITAYIPYSLLCGCIPIIEPYIDYTKEEYIKNFMSSEICSFSNGFAYGNTQEEIKKAIETREIGKNEAIKIFSEENVIYYFNKFITQIDNFYNKNINNGILTLNDVYV